MDEVGLVLDAGARVGEEDSPGLDVGHELLGQRVGQDVQGRGQDQPVPAEVAARPHHVDVDPGPEEGLLVPGDRALEAVALEARLESERPEAVVVVDDGHLRLHRRPGQDLLQRRVLRGHLRRLPVAPARLAVVTQETVPVLLAAGGAGAPPEPDLRVGPVGELLVGDLADLPRAGVAREGAPAQGAGGLLHDPEVLLLEAPHDVGGERRGVGDPGLRPVGEDRVVVPADEVQVPRQLVVVHLLEQAHEVVGDELAVRAQVAKDPDLVGLELDVEPRGVAHPVEAGARVGDGPGLPAPRVGDGDLAPGLDLEAPEVGAPGPVQLVEGPVPPAQPVLEARPAAIAAAVGAPELVVGLPADHAGVVLVVLGHGPGDALGQQPVGPVREAVVLAPAPHDAGAVRLHGQGLRVLPRHPGRHHRGRGAEDHLDVPGGEGLDGLVQPARSRTGPPPAP